MSPILIPAFPAVLRAGLPVVVTRASARGPGSGRTYAAVWLGELDGERFVARVCALDNGIFSPGMEQLGDEAIVQVDLRDPAAADAVVRAMWTKLRPGEPEPLTAPEWLHPWPNPAWHPIGGPAFHRPRWTLGGIRFDARQISEQHPDDVAREIVPCLASVPLDSPDRDLLALAAAACAVLS